LGCNFNGQGNEQAQSRSTQRQRDRLLGGHRRAFRPGQFKNHIPKLSAQSRQSILIFFLVYWLDWGSKAKAPGVGCPFSKAKRF
jgi:hypothetical protein